MSKGMIIQHEMDEILKNEFVGDRVDFIGKDGLWYERQLQYSEKHGLYIRHQGKITLVKHWGNDSVIRRVRSR